MSDERQTKLFALTPPPTPEKRFRLGDRPIWTENKARLIERYLYYFVMITKNGAYVDGFAGPQAPDHLDTWSAKRVLESEPRWLRKFFLFDVDAEKHRYLEELRAAQPAPEKGRPRKVEVFHADFNRDVKSFLERRPIGEKEAAFCLLDQQTTECEWETVRLLASYKTSRKIELFYFFPVGWLGRALAATKDFAHLDAWWGGPGWREIQGKPELDQTAMFVNRLKTELGYEYVTPWPIYKSPTERRIMYRMIHATDHLEAPGLMLRAYRRAVTPKESVEQLAIELSYLADQA